MAIGKTPFRTLRDDLTDPANDINQFVLRPLLNPSMSGFEFNNIGE